MRRRHFLLSLVIFVAGFALSAVVDGKRLASLTMGTLSNQAVAEVAAQPAQKTSPLPKWEYRVVSRFVAPGQADVDFELNRFGEQGYEMCGVAQSAGGPAGNVLTVVFRRPR